MATLRVGERIAREGRIAVGCSAAVFDQTGQRILLIRRADNDLWAVPGGYMDSGKSLTEACAREVREETGLVVTVERLISVYTNPHALLEYPDGNRWQLVVLHFEARYAGGQLAGSDEAVEVRYFSQLETHALTMGTFDRLRTDDAFAFQERTIVRDEFPVVARG